MRLYNLLDTIKGLAKSIPNMGTIGNGDIYDFNSWGNVQYPAFNITQQEITDNLAEEYRTFHLYLFTFDRLTENRSNEIAVQSHSVQVLKMIVDRLEEDGATIDSCVYHTFTERFSDECAGAYADVIIRTDLNECGEDNLEDILLAKIAELEEKLGQ